MEEKATGSAGSRARLKNTFGFGSSGARGASEMYSRLAESTGAQERTKADRARQEAAATSAATDAKAKKRAARIATGSKPNATMTERFYAKNPDAMKKGGVIKKFAKGGSIDGCAIRGKTRAPRTR
jgi:hypothetical protein